MGIGERLTQERKRLGLSQLDFAKQAQVSLSSQKRYETGERAPDTSYLESIKRIGADVTYILTETRRSTRDFGVDPFILAQFGLATAKIIGITPADILAAFNAAESSMHNSTMRDPYGSQTPDEAVVAYEEAFLMAVSDLLKRYSWP